MTRHQILANRKETAVYRMEPDAQGPRDRSSHPFRVGSEKTRRPEGWTDVRCECGESFPDLEDAYRHMEQEDQA